MLWNGMHSTSSERNFCILRAVVSSIDIRSWVKKWLLSSAPCWTMTQTATKPSKQGLKDIDEDFTISFSRIPTVLAEICFSSGYSGTYCC